MRPSVSITRTTSSTWASRPTSGESRCARSDSPVRVGACTSWPAARSGRATRSQHQPPCQAPWTRTNVLMPASLGDRVRAATLGTAARSGIRPMSPPRRPMRRGSVVRHPSCIPGRDGRSQIEHQPCRPARETQIIMVSPQHARRRSGGRRGGRARRRGPGSRRCRRGRPAQGAVTSSPAIADRLQDRWPGGTSSVIPAVSQTTWRGAARHRGRRSHGPPSERAHARSAGLRGGSRG